MCFCCGEKNKNNGSAPNGALPEVLNKELFLFPSSSSHCVNEGTYRVEQDISAISDLAFSDNRDTTKGSLNNEARSDIRMLLFSRKCEKWLFYVFLVLNCTDGVKDWLLSCGRIVQRLPTCVGGNSR